jgi:hypothetical protein
MKYSKEIVDFFKDFDTGIGLDLDPDQKTAVIFSNKNKIDEVFALTTNNVFFVSENIQQYQPFANKYPGLKLIEGNLLNTNLENSSIEFIIVDSGIINYDRNLVREELKRISTKDDYADVVILENEVNGVKENIITDEFLEFLYAGSWHEIKEFEFENDKGIKIKTHIYYNSIGFNQSELESKEIVEFIEACKEYCETIENYKNFTIKDFLFTLQKNLVNYYLKGFNLPNCAGSDGNTEISQELTEKDVTKFFKLYGDISTFLGKDDIYWSNLDPYPENNDIETISNSLSNDLCEIYEDIKYNLIAYQKGTLYDKQDLIWDWKFNWKGHTGDHWTFAVRAIHWKLEDLE